MPEHEIKALRRIHDAFSRWDVDELATDVFRDHVEGQWADPDDFVDGDDAVVVLGRLRGRSITTGREYEVHVADAWTLSEGMPARCRSYFDTAPVMAALGSSR